MKKTQKNKTKEKEKDITFSQFFKLVDKVAKKAETDRAFKKLIDSAAEQWLNDSRYAS